jgi:hypothetical protein
MNKELTQEQLDQIDDLHQLCYDTMSTLLGEELEWNMEWIGQLADYLTSIGMRYFDKTEMEIFPIQRTNSDIRV